MSRNVFENNSSELSSEDLAALGGKEFMILPRLPEGQWYEIEHVGDRVIVVIEKG